MMSAQITKRAYPKPRDHISVTCLRPHIDSTPRIHDPPIPGPDRSTVDAMAAASATVASSSVSSSTFFSGGAAASSFAAKPIVGFPALKKVQVSCMAKGEKREGGAAASVASGAVASALMAVQPAMALVDERLSTEGTGLSLGVSNPLLIWILLGVATLVWALFFTYASTLPEGDDDSGLAL